MAAAIFFVRISAATSCQTVCTGKWQELRPSPVLVETVMPKLWPACNTGQLWQGLSWEAQRQDAGSQGALLPCC